LPLEFSGKADIDDYARVRRPALLHPKTASYLAGITYPHGGCEKENKMHIEPGLVAPAKVAIANVGAIAIFAWGFKEQVKEFLKQPWILMKSLLAAAFFSLFMQSYSIPIGPSELHFVGAMAMYLTLGFTPTLLGFGAGLLFQGIAFDPGDLVHLGVNSLTLMLPLITTHYVSGRQYFQEALSKRLSWFNIVKLDAIYYVGVSGMVGFWLLVGDVATPFASWATFMASYMALVVLEPVVTFAAVKGLKAFEDTKIVARLTSVGSLTIS